MDGMEEACQGCLVFVHVVFSADEVLQVPARTGRFPARFCYLVLYSSTRSFRNTDGFNQMLNMSRWCCGYRRNNVGGDEVHHCAYRSNGQRRNTKHVIGWYIGQIIGARYKEPAFINEDINSGENQA